ncbi:MAG: flavin monoamine oxidase family protein [Bosea sp. (in: a-proteobacteria)]
MVQAPTRRFAAKPNRRAVLAGLGAAFLGISSRAAQTADVDVVVIGAGAAGLAAGRELQRRGLQFVIVEADARVGGRMMTNDSLGVPFEAGANFIHFRRTNPLTRLGVAAGLGLRPTGDLFAGAIVSNRGERLGDKGLQARSAAFEVISGLHDAAMSGRDISMSDAAAGQTANVQLYTQIYAQMATGENPERISVHDLHQLADGDDYRIQEGHSALARFMARDMPIRLGVRVQAIDWSGGGVIVTTDQGAIRARAAILTVSIALLQQARIQMTPGLPLSHLRALDGFSMGSLSKIAFRVVDGETFGFRPHQFLIETGEPSRAVTFEALPFGRPVITGNFGGDYARDLAKAGEAAAIEEFRDRLALIAGSQFKNKIERAVFASWVNAPFVHGGYAVVKPGMTGARQALARPIGRHVWICGEATAGVHAMTTGGAFIAGRAAARQILI